jgi:hypothetical protein
MSQPRAIGHSIPDVSFPKRALIAVARAGETVLHPIALLRRLRSPNVVRPSVASMTPDQFEAYARRTGIEARLKAVLSEGDASEDHAAADDGLLSGQSEP